MTLESNSESLPESNAAVPQNVFSRLMGVYFSPGKTFREIGRSPGVLMPVIVMVVVGLALGFYLSKTLDMEALLIEQMDEAVARGRMTEEQLESQLPTIVKFAEIQTLVSTALGGLFMSLIIAAGFKLISMLVGAENGFKAIFTVTVYTLLAISIVSYALFVVILSLKDPGEVTARNLNSIVTSSLGGILASLFGEEVLPKFFMRLAGWIDLFAIWAIALLSIGYSAVSRKLKTSTAAVWLSAVYGVIAISASLIMSIFS